MLSVKKKKVKVNLLKKFNKEFFKSQGLVLRCCGSDIVYLDLRHTKVKHSIKIEESIKKEYEWWIYFFETSEALYAKSLVEIRALILSRVEANDL